jgi:adenylyltransferase/sulfurtransferase
MAELRIVDHTRDRYHSLAISTVWQLTRLRKARALVVGTGALGNEVCKNLAMMGMELIVVLDRDTVEMANLSRSIFFRERDRARPKTAVIRERLADVNPDVKVLELQGDLDSVLGLGLVRRMDVVFSCLDSRLARRSVNRMCEKVGKPWVDGAMEDLLGEVAVYVPGMGPCYECSLTQAQKAALAEAVSCRGIALRNLSLGKVPTTSTMGSIISALQVQEGIRLIHGHLQNGLVGKRLVVNCNINDFYVTSSERNEDCDGHERFGEVSELQDLTAATATAQGLLEMFKQETGEDGFVDLGREVVIQFRCEMCDASHDAGIPLSEVDSEVQRCSNCGAPRLVATTHLVKAGDEYAEWALGRLGIPPLDVLQVQGANSVRWYELSGDAVEFGLAPKAEAAISS